MQNKWITFTRFHKISQGHFGAQCATVPVFLCLDPGARGAEPWAPPLWVAFSAAAIYNLLQPPACLPGQIAWYPGPSLTVLQMLSKLLFLVVQSFNILWRMYMSISTTSQISKHNLKVYHCIQASFSHVYKRMWLSQAWHDINSLRSLNPTYTILI
jgi:hypothetical protein